MSYNKFKEAYFKIVNEPITYNDNSYCVVCEGDIYANNLQDISFNQIYDGSGNLTEQYTYIENLQSNTIDDINLLIESNTNDITSLQTDVSTNTTNIANNTSAINQILNDINYTTTEGNTFFTNNVDISGNLTVNGDINGLSQEIFSLLTTLNTSIPVEDRIFALSQFQNTIQTFFYNIQLPAPNDYDLNFFTENIHLGLNIDVSNNITCQNVNASGNIFCQELDVSGNINISTINDIDSSKLISISDYNNTNGTIETRLDELENNVQKISYNSTSGFTDIVSNVGVYGNLNFTENINGISASVFNNIAGGVSNFQQQINDIVTDITLSSTVNTRLDDLENNVQKISYNSTSQFTDIVSNVGVYGNLNFTENINGISASIFNYIEGGVSNFQQQINDIVADISNNYVDKTSDQAISGTKNFNTISATNASINNLSNGVMNTSRITFNTIDDVYQKRKLVLGNDNIVYTSSDYPTTYVVSSNITLPTNLPNNCYVKITSGCTVLTMNTVDEDSGKNIILVNSTIGNITINTQYPQYFTGFVGYGNSFNLPPYGRCLICNADELFWDVVYIQSYYNFNGGGIWLLNSNNNYDSGATALHYSCPNLNNVFNQPTTTGSISSADRQNLGESAAGSYIALTANDSANSAIVYPGWGAVFYENTNYTGTVLLNYKNTTKNPVCVNLSSSNVASSVRIYYFDQELGSL